MKKYDKNSVGYYLLKNWSSLLMMRKGNISDNIPRYNKKIVYAVNKPQILELILQLDPTLKKAYQWKEDYLDFNEDFTYETAPAEFDRLYNELVEYNFSEFQDIITMLGNWHEEILNSFITIDGRRISNGPVESIKGKIKTILKVSLKFKNFERLRNRIMYCLNKKAVPSVSDEKKTNKGKGKKRGAYKKRKK